MATVIETDSRSRVVLPGHANQRFIVQEHEDGSILLQPAVVVNVAEKQDQQLNRREGLNVVRYGVAIQQTMQK